MRPMIDLTGKTFHRLTVLHLVDEKGDRGERYWNCQCECGNTKVIQGQSLRIGNTKSCGCLRRETASKTGKKFGPLSKQHFKPKSDKLSSESTPS